MSNLVGPNGHPLSVEDATKLSQQNAENTSLKQAEYKMMIARWQAFAEIDSADVALTTIQGKELLSQGFDEEAVKKLHFAVRITVESIPPNVPEEQKGAAILQTSEFMIGVAIGHPSIVGRLEFVGTLAALEAGLITRKTGNEAQHDDDRAQEGELEI